MQGSGQCHKRKTRSQLAQQAAGRELGRLFSVPDAEQWSATFLRSGHRLRISQPDTSSRRRGSSEDADSHTLKIPRRTSRRRRMVLDSPDRTESPEPTGAAAPSDRVDPTLSEAPEPALTSESQALNDGVGHPDEDMRSPVSPLSSLSSSPSPARSTKLESVEPAGPVELAQQQNATDKERVNAPPDDPRIAPAGRSVEHALRRGGHEATATRAQPSSRQARTRPAPPPFPTHRTSQENFPLLPSHIRRVHGGFSVRSSSREGSLPDFVHFVPAEGTSLSPHFHRALDQDTTSRATTSPTQTAMGDTGHLPGRDVQPQRHRATMHTGMGSQMGDDAPLFWPATARTHQSESRQGRLMSRENTNPDMGSTSPTRGDSALEEWIQSGHRRLVSPLRSELMGPPMTEGSAMGSSTLGQRDARDQAMRLTPDLDWQFQMSQQVARANTRRTVPGWAGPVQASRLQDGHQATQSPGLFDAVRQPPPRWLQPSQNSGYTTMTGHLAPGADRDWQMPIELAPTVQESAIPDLTLQMRPSRVDSPPPLLASQRRVPPRLRHQPPLTLETRDDRSMASLFTSGPEVDAQTPSSLDSEIDWLLAQPSRHTLQTQAQALQRAQTEAANAALQQAATAQRRREQAIYAVRTPSQTTALQTSNDSATGPGQPPTVSQEMDPRAGRSIRLLSQQESAQWEAISASAAQRRALRGTQAARVRTISGNTMHMSNAFPHTNISPMRQQPADQSVQWPMSHSPTNQWTMDPQAIRERAWSQMSQMSHMSQMSPMSQTTFHPMPGPSAALDQSSSASSTSVHRSVSHVRARSISEPSRWAAGLGGKNAMNQFLDPQGNVQPHYNAAAADWEPFLREQNHQRSTELVGSGSMGQPSLLDSEHTLEATMFSSPVPRITVSGPEEPLRPRRISANHSFHSPPRLGSPSLPNWPTYHTSLNPSMSPVTPVDVGADWTQPSLWGAEGIATHGPALHAGLLGPTGTSRFGEAAQYQFQTATDDSQISSQLEEPEAMGDGLGAMRQRAQRMIGQNARMSSSMADSSLAEWQGRTY